MTMWTGQCLSSLLIASNVVTFALLTMFWDAGAPAYPMFIAATVLGSVISFSTFFVLFPLVSTFYGGWLIAPVRAGTDLSCLLTTLLAEAQNPTGTFNRFPMWVLYVVYMAVSATGFVAWMVILRHGIGLRESTVQGGAKHEQQSIELSDYEGQQEQLQKQQRQSEERPGHDRDRRTAEQSSGSSETEGEIGSSGSEAKAQAQPKQLAALRKLMGGLACPKSLIAPIGCATLSQVLQWSVVSAIAQIGARMTDPEGCDGEMGKQAYRIALTLSNVLVPVGSFMSSYAECPRWLFYSLGSLQLAAATAVVLATAGVGQVLWFTAAGRGIYVACVAAVAGLEGYVLTMAYRYIGDCMSLPLDLKLSASSLLSFLSIVLVNPVSIMVGVLVDGGEITCTGLS
mmetsp:Transcript_7261/g.15019  ORF Transcript_7261/g.15019 Transcript_7261/m.15019 type:complete len:399 (+) Transcript_7261:95-1291(+)